MLPVWAPDRSVTLNQPGPLSGASGELSLVGFRTGHHRYLRGASQFMDKERVSWQLRGASLRALPPRRVLTLSAHPLHRSVT